MKGAAVTRGPPGYNRRVLYGTILVVRTGEMLVSGTVYVTAGGAAEQMQRKN